MDENNIFYLNICVVKDWTALLIWRMWALRQDLTFRYEHHIMNQLWFCSKSSKPKCVHLGWCLKDIKNKMTQPKWRSGINNHSWRCEHSLLSNRQSKQTEDWWINKKPEWNPYQFDLVYIIGWSAQEKLNIMGTLSHKISP